jgi:hypothetical protein
MFGNPCILLGLQLSSSMAFQLNSCHYRNRIVDKKIQILAIRAVAGLFFAVIISRFFKPDAGVPYIVGLAVILVALAYFAEFLRKRKNR